MNDRVPKPLAKKMRAAARTRSMQAPLTANSSASSKKVAPAARLNGAPDRFTYQLKNYTIEIRTDSWHIAQTVSAFHGEKPSWVGPFLDIENACLAIARRMFVEVADRHTRSVEAHDIQPGNPLYGLKTTTRLPDADEIIGKEQSDA